jgi:hypothetical protein
MSAHLMGIFIMFATCPSAVGEFDLGIQAADARIHR